MDLYEAVYKRKSVRKYRMEILDDSVLNHIIQFTQRLEMLDENQKAHFEIIDNTRGKGAPYYLVLTAPPVEGYQINAGFLMEQVMLYILTKGLGSCFMQYHPQNIQLKPGFEAVIMLAFGKTDKNICREPGREKRFQLKDICTFKASADNDMRKIVNAGRLAPSSFNSQPWRFVVYENRIHLFCKKEKGILKPITKLYKIDAGAALANMYLAAEELWYTCEIKRIENLKEQSFKNHEYLISLLFAK